MLKKILLGIVVMVVVLIAVFLVMVMMQPAHYQVERSATINAPAPAVFALVNDFHKWDSWSPWAKLDPAMKQSYEGAPAGTGAIYSWAGNSEVGVGKMTITESRPSDLVKIKLEFIKPFAATNATDFTFTPSGNSTSVPIVIKFCPDRCSTHHVFFCHRLISVLIDDALINSAFDLNLVSCVSSW
jgi:ribosome-associated toxin RatA of RatAB toxin-antitoxin module